VRGQEFWGIASPSDAYHLPQILPQELQPFERSGDDFGEVFLRVWEFLCSSCTDCPLVFGGQPARGCGPFCRLFRQNSCFSGGSVFLQRTVRSCLPDRSPHPGGQSAVARRTVRSVHRILPSLIGSFGSSLVLPHVLRGIVPRTCS
jgi:hypothetical protein